MRDTDDPEFESPPSVDPDNNGAQHGRVDSSTPAGPLDASEHGELRVRIALEGDTVVLRFDKPVVWIGMSRLEAGTFAELLKAKAAEL